MTGDRITCDGRPRRLSRQARFAAAGALVSALGGCAWLQGPDVEAASPNVALASNFPSAPAQTPRDVDRQDVEPGDDWWRAYGSEPLNALVARAIQENRDLRIAATNVDEADAALKSARRQFLPALSARSTYQATVQNGTLTTDANVGADLAWELDLFGRIRNEVAANRAAREATLQLRGAALLAAIRDVVEGYLQAAALRERTASLRERRARQVKAVEATRKLASGQLATSGDVAQAQAELASIDADLSDVERQRIAQLNRLATLTATPIDALRARAKSWPRGLPRTPALGAAPDPAALLHRRPDVLAAEQEVYQTASRIGVARSELFPRVGVDLGVSAGDFLGPNAFTGLFVGPSVQWNFLDRGAAIDRLNIADARFERANARYEQTVLAAIEEVDNALSRYVAGGRRAAALGTAEAESRKAETLAERRFTNGVGTFLQWLSARRDRQDARDARLSAEADALIAFADFKAAVGAGFAAAESELDALELASADEAR